MASSTFQTQQPLTMPFDAFASYPPKTQSYLDFSPDSLYGQLDDLGTDFTTDSAPSPLSPMSPIFSGTYSLPQENDWTAWDAKIEQSPEPNLFKSEPLNSPTLGSFTPAPFNQADDFTTPDDAVIFGCEGMNDTQPLFQSLPSPANPSGLARSSQRPSTTMKGTSSSHSTNAVMSSRRTAGVRSQQQQLKPQQQQQQPARRYPTRNLKRKSPSVSEDDDPEDEDDSRALSHRSSTSPPPAARRCTAAKDYPSRTAKDAATAPAPAPATGSATAPKKTAHNMIEKRYRNNLNDKIAALRDAVPALRVMVHRLEGPDASGDDAEDESIAAAATGARRRSSGGRGARSERSDAADGLEELGGLAPAHKLNKATILGKATEYIMHLERRNRHLAEENSTLRNRVEDFENVFMGKEGASGPIWN